MFGLENLKDFDFIYTIKKNQNKESSVVYWIYDDYQNLIFFIKQRLKNISSSKTKYYIVNSKGKYISSVYLKLSNKEKQKFDGFFQLKEDKFYLIENKKRFFLFKILNNKLYMVEY